MWPGSEGLTGTTARASPRSPSLAQLASLLKAEEEADPGSLDVEATPLSAQRRAGGRARAPPKAPKGLTNEAGGLSDETAAASGSHAASVPANRRATRPRATKTAPPTKKQRTRRRRTASSDDSDSDGNESMDDDSDEDNDDDDDDDDDDDADDDVDA